MIHDEAGADRPNGYSLGINVIPATENRNRLTTAFRFFLALPHLFLVGGPAAVGGWLSWSMHDGTSWSATGGVLGAVVGVATIIAWLVIVLTGRHPDIVRRLAIYYLRWRIRAIAYMALLRDEYPPFGAGDYPAGITMAAESGERNRLTVFFRALLAVPHLIALLVILALWTFTTAIAWVMILLTGRYPETLYGFALGALAWSARVEAYLLLLTDEYPPFSLRA
jgi:hypothetical protein